MVSDNVNTHTDSDNSLAGEDPLENLLQEVNWDDYSGGKMLSETSVKIDDNDLIRQREQEYLAGHDILDRACYIGLVGAHNVYMVERENVKTGAILSNVDKGDFCGEWSFVLRENLGLMSYKVEKGSLRPIGFGKEIDLSKVKWVVDDEISIVDDAENRLLPIMDKVVALGNLVYPVPRQVNRCDGFAVNDCEEVDPGEITVRLRNVRGLGAGSVTIVYRIDYGHIKYDLPNYGLYLQ